VEFETCFCQSIEQQHALQKTVIFGDFNINYNKINSNAKVNQYANHIMEQNKQTNINSVGLNKIISHPTRIIPKTKTTINHIYVTNFEANEIESAILSLDISDHLPTFLHIRTITPKKQQIRPLIRKFSVSKLELEPSLLKSNKSGLSLGNFLYPNLNYIC